MSHPPEAQIYIGKLLNGRYLVERFITEGGFCLLFEGVDKSLGDPVAIKILKMRHTTNDALEFETEGQLLKLLQPASKVVDCRHSGVDSIDLQVAGSGAGPIVPIDVRFHVLELATSSLIELLLADSRTQFSDRLRVFREVVLGIHQMHLRSVVHRDLKSENVLLFLRGRQSTEAKVADLGRSRLLSESPRFPANAYFIGRGDLRFAPPEAFWWQLTDEGNSFRRADLYLLGSVLYELTTGQGITSTALPDGIIIAQQTQQLPDSIKTVEFRARINEIRSRYEPAFEQFESQVPACLRNYATSLLRQLCDPDPVKRERRVRADPKEVWGLQWLLRRSDIMILALQRAERPSNQNWKRTA